MDAAQGGTTRAGGAQAPRGRTRWGVVTAVLGLPAPALGVLLLMRAVRVLVS